MNITLNWLIVWIKAKMLSLYTDVTRIALEKTEKSN